MKTKNEIQIRDRKSSEVEPEDDLEDELRLEYDAAVLKNGVRGKYLAQFGCRLTTQEEIWHE